MGLFHQEMYIMKFMAAYASVMILRWPPVAGRWELLSFQVSGGVSRVQLWS